VHLQHVCRAVAEHGSLCARRAKLVSKLHDLAIGVNHSLGHVNRITLQMREAEHQPDVIVRSRSYEFLPVGAVDRESLVEIVAKNRTRAFVRAEVISNEA
jgi:hypothetical protein